VLFLDGGASGSGAIRVPAHACLPSRVSRKRGSRSVAGRGQCRSYGRSARAGTARQRAPAHVSVAV